MKERKYLEYLALAALLTTFFGYFAVKVWDIDFWWHIAAGKNILETGVVPSVDPFGVYEASSSKGQAVLKSEWLGQVMLYEVFRWFDVEGIILLRAGILSACLGIVYWRCHLLKVSGSYSLCITALAGLAILNFTGERPNLFSFLLFSLVLLLLDRFMANGKRWQLYCIPLAMLLWVNVHGAALLGYVVLGLFWAGYVLQARMSGGRFNSPEIKFMSVILALSAATMWLQPNGLETIKAVIFFETSQIPIRDLTSEYARPWEVGQIALYYWIFLGAAIIALPGLFKQDFWKQGMLVLVVGAFSLTAYRYIPFFVLLAAPYVAASLGRMLQRCTPPAFVINFSILVIALSFLGYGLKQGRVFQHGALDNKFPSGAVDFMEANNLGGKMFNSMSWGGYLLWRLPGKVTIFIDGRVLDMERMIPYTHILWATPEGQRFFDQGDFNLALVPHGNMFTGERYPLVSYLKSRPDWQAVYQDGSGYLFARRAK